VKILLVTLQPILVLAIAVVLAGCNNDDNGPSNSTTTTTSTSSVATTTSTVAATTTTVPTSFNVTGTISDATDNQPVGTAAEIEFLTGPRIGQKVTAVNSVYTITGLSAGSFTMRVRAVGYNSADRTVDVTNANVTLNVSLARNLSFSTTPDPCTITMGTITNCTLNGPAQTGRATITSWTWSSSFFNGSGQFYNVPQFACGDYAGQQIGIPVTLVVAFSGGTGSVTQTITVRKQGACGF
jgi:hypothetical protein